MVQQQLHTTWEGSGSGMIIGDGNGLSAVAVGHAAVELVKVKLEVRSNVGRFLA